MQSIAEIPYQPQPTPEGVVVTAEDTVPVPVPGPVPWENIWILGNVVQQMLDLLNGRAQTLVQQEERLT